EFLRHTERARVLVMILDPTNETSPEDQLRILDGEIGRYSAELAARPRLVLVNKSDVGDVSDRVTDAVKALGALAVSAMTGDGLDSALHRIADLVDLAEREAPERKGFILHRPLGPSFTVRREGNAWRIEGRAVERAVRFADLTLDEAADMAARRLASMGVDRALAEAGARPPDEVRIGELSFEYQLTEEE